MNVTHSWLELSGQPGAGCYVQGWEFPVDPQISIFLDSFLDHFCNSSKFNEKM